jgi:hypothetical protein
MIKKFLSTGFLLLASLTGWSQATIPVSGTKVVGANQQPLTGNLVFTVTDANDVPVTYTPQGGSPTTAAITIPVTRGVVQYVGGYPAQIPNPATMSPADTRYRVQVEDSSSSVVFFTFPLVNITQNFFSYDSYRVPAGVTASGMGMPQIPCDPSAMYNDTKASAPYPWVCSQLKNDGVIAWTQNPSLNPKCQKGNVQATVSPMQGAIYCIDATQAFVTPGYALAGPAPNSNMPGQIGLVPISQLCAGGACGTGGTPAPPQYAVQFAGPSASAFTADPSFTFNPTTHELGSLVDNNSFQAKTAGVANIQSTIAAAGTTGSVEIPANTPALLPIIKPTFSIISTGGTLGPGTYTYATCLISNGVQQSCTTGTVTISSGTTNQVQWNGPSASYNYAVYGRTGPLANLGYLFTYVAHTPSFRDDGSTTPGASLVGTISNPNNIMIDDLRYGVLSHFAKGVPVREFCGIESENNPAIDATDCIQAAINYAEASGVRVVDFTPGATYIVTGTRGTVPLGGDDGTCPSGSTVNGAPCTPLDPLYAYQAYSLIIHGGPLRINFNGAQIRANYTLTQAVTTAMPAMIACYSGDQTNSKCNNVVLDGGAGGNGTKGGFGYTPIAFLAPGTLSFSSFQNLSIDPNVGFGAIIQRWDKNRMINTTVSAAAGVIIGGWYTNRGNTTSPRTGNQVESGGYCDGCTFTDDNYNGAAGFLALHANTDDYFYQNIYQGQNQGNGRMVDVPGTSSPNGPDSLNVRAPYRGVFGQGIAMFGRYGRNNGGPRIVNLVTKAAARSAIVGMATMSDVFVQGVSGETDGLCDDGIHAVGDPTYCPDPWGTGGLTSGFLNAINGFSGGQILSISSGSPTRYAREISGVNPNTSVFGVYGDLANNQVATYGPGVTAANSPEPTGKFTSFAFQNGHPQTSGAPQNVNDTWQLQDFPNYNVAYGGVWDVTHVENQATGWAFRVPYLALKNNPTQICDAGSTGYSGHQGWINFIAGASGVADSVSICSKDASNTYAWRTLLGGGASMVYPGAGIPVSTGTAWGTSLTAPSGALVGTTDTQALTNKTIDGVTPTTMSFLDATSSIQTQLDAKQPTLALSTTGSSGPATLTGSNLNIPQYAYTLPQATTSVLGGVKCDGTTITCSAGVISTVAGSGNVSTTGMTVGTFPVALTSTSQGDGPLSTDGTTLTSTQPIAVTDASGRGGGVDGTEGTAPTGATGVDNLWADATDHRLKMNNGNTGATDIVGMSDQASALAYGVVKVDGTTIIASSGVISAVSGIANATLTISSGTTVSAGACLTAATVAMTGVTTATSFSLTPSTDITTVTGWTPTASLYISDYPTADTLNYRVCNDTSSSITTGADVTFNVGAR